MDRKYIPLTDTFISDHMDHLYIYLSMVRNQLIFEKHWFEEDNNSVYVKLNDDYVATRDKIGMHRNNFNPIAKQLPLEIRYTEEFITLMPFEVWDNFTNFINATPMRSRNSWTKLYIFIYHNAVAHPHGKGFYHSVENLAAELQMDHADVSEKLIKLEQCGFICRSKYNRYFNQARSYSIPDSDKYSY